MIKKLFNAFLQSLKEAFETSIMLFKIMVPVIIITKIFKEIGAIDILGKILSPAMYVLGLPGEMGLVWASAMLTNLYGGMIVFAQLAPDIDLTVAQVSVLATVMLVAHALPIELKITQKAGPRVRFMGILRVGGALVLGSALNFLYTKFDYLQQKSPLLWQPDSQPSTWIDWSLGELRNLIYIFCVILSLIILLKVLKKIGFTDLLTKILNPILMWLGIGKETAPITIIGMTLGLGYGGGLIIKEAQADHIKPYDIFFSLCFLSLCHSLIEDTLLMILMGGHVSGVLWGRIIFTFIIIIPLVRIVRKIPQSVFERLFFRIKKAA